jgi:uncharacterized surface protein with fasciclin (FAS1) repeats
MRMTRSSFLSLVVAAAVGASLSVATPGFAKGGSGSGGGAGKGSSGGPTAKTPPAKAKNVLEVIQGDTSLSKFAEALKTADLEGTLKGSGPFTVFAPNDTAFGKVDAAKLAALMKDKEKLKTILQGHILGSKMTAADVAKATKLSAMGSVSHEVKLGDDKQAVIDGVAKIVKSDVTGSNGLIQIVDTVLLPAEKTDNKDGKDGKDGKDSKDGKDGKDSKDGKDGKDNKDGKDAK